MCDDFPAVVLGFGLGLGLTVIVCGAIFGAEQRLERESAIKAKVAEWQINPATGEKKFVYLSPPTIAPTLEAEGK